mgnify:FL=1
MDKEKSILIVKIITSIIILFIPNISNFLTLAVNAIGGYFIAFFVASCITIGFSFLYIGISIVKYIQNKD